MIFPRMSLHSKLVPVQYREYEYGLFRHDFTNCMCSDIGGIEIYSYRYN